MTRKFRTLDPTADRKHVAGNVVYTSLEGIRIGKGSCLAGVGWSFSCPAEATFNTIAVWTDTGADVTITADNFTTNLGDTFSSPEVIYLYAFSGSDSNMRATYADGILCEIYVDATTVITVDVSSDVNDLEVFLLKC